MAKLKSVLTKDEYEAMSAELRALGVYEERGDTYVLDADVRTHPETTNLVRALESERGNVKTWKEKAAAFEGLGLSPEEIAALKTKHDRQGDASPDEITKKVEEEVTRRVAPIEKARAEEKARADAAETRARSLTIDTHHRNLAAKAGVRAERLERALELNRRRFGLDKDGQHHLVDEKGNPEALTPEKFWAEVFKEELPEFYAGTGSTGGGAGEGGRGAGKTVALGDEKAFLDHISDIAAGKVAVR